MINLIGVTGKAGSGKTTIANYIRDNYLYAQLNFADPIKQGLASMLGLTLEDLDKLKITNEPINDYLDINVRRLLQTLGTEWGRNTIDKDFWCYLMEEKIDNLIWKLIPTTNFVIGDVRFVNEVNWINNKGGTTILVKRDNKITEKTTRNHQSEVEIESLRDIVTYSVNNSGSHASLFYQIDGIMKELGLRKRSKWLIALSKWINSL